MSQITTHVLDTSTGKPARGLIVELKATTEEGGWETIASGITNSDGRIGDLLSPELRLRPGSYRMDFHTGDYFSQSKQVGFYPQVNIVFTITDGSHYHIPLLLSPFGYSTYRGS